MTPVLLKLLEGNGINVPLRGNEEALIRCFSPFHEDKTPSMSVNVAKGVYYCHGCGIKGNAYSFLVEFCGFTASQAMEYLESQGWTKDKIRYSQNEIQRKEDKRAGLPKHVAKPYEQLSQDVKAVAIHDYENLDGDLVCRYMRYKSTTKSSKAPKLLPFVPAKRGGWWCAGPLNDGIPEEDVKITKYIPYRMRELADAPDSAMIWVVEGEKCVDAVMDTVKDQHAPKNYVATCFHGKTDMTRTDFSLLIGKRILLLSDTDKVSRNYMTTMAAYLTKQGCAVRMVLPPGEGGYDIADALGEGGWKGAKQWITKIGVKQYVDIIKKDTAGSQSTAIPPMDETEHFRVLGFYKENIVIQQKRTHEIHLIRRNVLSTAGNLIVIAPNMWWRELTDGVFTEQVRIALADALIRAAEAKGNVDMNALSMGRGAKRIGDDVCYNIGDRVLLPDAKGLLTEEVSFDEVDTVMRPGVPIKVVDSMDAMAHAYDFADAVTKYRWLTERDGRVFLGWLVTSLVGGALDFRPSMWILAPAVSGKTFLLNNVLRPFFGDAGRNISDVTEAGLSFAMGSDSLPAMIDEFEPGASKIAEEKWRAVLSLIRMASSGSGQRIRGIDNVMTNFVSPRFSVVLSSIRRPELDKADSSRFVPVYLDRHGVENWPAVRAHIEDATRKEKMIAVRSSVIRYAQVIAEEARDIEDAIGQKYKLDSREAMTYAALTVGYRFISGNKDAYITPIVEKYSSESLEPLNDILSYTVRIPNQPEISLGDCLVRGFLEGEAEFTQDARRVSEIKFYQSIAARYGLMIELIEYKDGYKTLEEAVLHIAFSESKLKKTLAHSRWSNISLKEYLLSLPGAVEPKTQSGAPKRYRFNKIQKSVITVPHNILMDAGLPV